MISRRRRAHLIAIGRLADRRKGPRHLVIDRERYVITAKELKISHENDINPNAK